MKNIQEGKSLRSQLRTWLKEICPKQNVEDYCQVLAESKNPEVLKARIYTHDYRYTIFATEKGVDKIPILTCSALQRKSLAGLDSFTGHLYADLVDGKFCRVTWELIKAAILRFELVKITAKAKVQWQRMTSHFQSNGKHYYVEWLQKGDMISEHKTYELVGEKEEGKPAMERPVKKPE